MNLSFPLYIHKKNQVILDEVYFTYRNAFNNSDSTIGKCTDSNGILRKEIEIVS